MPTTLPDRSASMSMDGPLSPSTPGTGTGAANKTNALANRITSVLSASYSDLDIRDALETLDARGLQNTQETRRKLRLDVQREVIQCNGDIVKDFGLVAAQLRRIGSAIDVLNKSCASMRAHIDASTKESQPVLEEGSKLLTEKSQVETKQKVLDAFTAHFNISAQESVILTSTAEPVNDAFFQVLTRVKKIHHDCQLLLGGESQTLGLELLEQSSKQLNAAFQKLYRWIQREFKTLDLENPRINTSIRRSIRILAERPTLFQSCLDFFAEAREHVLSDSFYGALTGDSDSHMKPIEVQAHDPLRYIGDMLAWAHSSAVSEREALEVLFVSEGDEIAKSIQHGLESEPWTQDDEEPREAFDGRKALNELVGRDLRGVARLLRQRTEQVIQSHEDAVVVYKVANLIGFYRTTFHKLLTEESEFSQILHGLEESAVKQFRTNMRDYVATIQNDIAVAPADLSPPDFLLEALDVLKDLLKSYDSSFAAASDDGETAFQPILAEALDPFLSGCESISKTLTEPDNDIFAINCLLEIRGTLQPFLFTEERLTDLEESLEEHVLKLAEFSHRFMLDQSHLNSLLFSLGEISGNDATEVTKKILTLAAFQPDSLIASSQALDNFLPSALMDVKDNIRRVRDARIVQRIAEEAAERFCADFERVEEMMVAADEFRDATSDGDDDRPLFRELFPRSGAEIRVLLS